MVLFQNGDHSGKLFYKYLRFSDFKQTRLKFPRLISRVETAIKATGQSHIVDDFDLLDST